MATLKMPYFRFYVDVSTVIGIVMWNNATKQSNSHTDIICKMISKGNGSVTW